MNDLVDESKNLQSKVSLENRYNMSIKQMEYNSLIDSIPKHWLTMLKDNKSSELTPTLQIDNLIRARNTFYNTNTLTNKVFYNIYIVKRQRPPTSHCKWIDEFPFLNDEDFKNFYILPLRVITDTKVQVFQFKLLHRIIACKTKLLKWESRKIIYVDFARKWKLLNISSSIVKPRITSGDKSKSGLRTTLVNTYTYQP